MNHRLSFLEASKNHRLQICMPKLRPELGQGNILNGWRALPLTKTYWNLPSYLSPLASKTSFTEWHAKPSWAPTLICFPCCPILASSKEGTWDLNSVIQTNPWITNFLLLVTSSLYSRDGARKTWQWACTRFISVCCDQNLLNIGHE